MKATRQILMLIAGSLIFEGTTNAQTMKKTETVPLPAQVRLLPGQGGLPKLVIQSGRSTAEIYLHGAQVTSFQKNSEPPLLFLSAASQFAADKPIRGGVPIVFPWFGPRVGLPMHGYARLAEWQLETADTEKNGDVKISLRLPESGLPADWRAAQLRFDVTVGEKLTMELTVTNLSPEQSLSFENALHTYFAVGDSHGGDHHRTARRGLH